MTELEQAVVEAIRGVESIANNYQLGKGVVEIPTRHINQLKQLVWAAYQKSLEPVRDAKKSKKDEPEAA